MNNEYKIAKRSIKELFDYVETIHDLLDNMSMDEDAKHFIDDELMDRHYSVRYIAQELLEKSTNKAEIY